MSSVKTNWIFNHQQIETDIKEKEGAEISLSGGFYSQKYSVWLDKQPMKINVESTIRSRVNQFVKECTVNYAKAAEYV